MFGMREGLIFGPISFIQQCAWNMLKPVETCWNLLKHVETRKIDLDEVMLWRCDVGMMSCSNLHASFFLPRNASSDAVWYMNRFTKKLHTDKYRIDDDSLMIMRGR